MKQHGPFIPIIGIFIVTYYYAKGDWIPDTAGRYFGSMIIQMLSMFILGQILKPYIL